MYNLCMNENSPLPNQDAKAARLTSDSNEATRDERRDELEGGLKTLINLGVRLDGLRQAANKAHGEFRKETDNKIVNLVPEGNPITDGTIYTEPQSTLMKNVGSLLSAFREQYVKSIPDPMEHASALLETLTSDTIAVSDLHELAGTFDRTLNRLTQHLQEGPLSLVIQVNNALTQSTYNPSLQTNKTKMAAIRQAVTNAQAQYSSIIKSMNGVNSTAKNEINRLISILEKDTRESLDSIL